MYRQTTTPVLQKSVLDALLTTLDTTATAAFTTPKIELFSNNPSLGPTNNYSDFTMVNFSGYAPAAVTLQATSNLIGLDQCRVSSGYFEATTTATFTAATANGYVISDGATKVYMVESFQTPVQFNVPGDFLQVDVIVPLKVRPTFQTS